MADDQLQRQGTIRARAIADSAMADAPRGQTGVTMMGSIVWTQWGFQ
jgi:hypothetical protein